MSNKYTAEYLPLTDTEFKAFTRAMDQTAYYLSHHHPEDWPQYICRILEDADMNWHEHDPSTVVQMYEQLIRDLQARLDYRRLELGD